jgi:hypothetical protein
MNRLRDRNGDEELQACEVQQNLWGNLSLKNVQNKSEKIVDTQI